MAKPPAQRQREYRQRKRQARLAAVPPPPQDATGGSQPPALGDAGQALWNDVTGSWDLAAHEQLILRQACRAADRADQVAAALTDAPLTVTNVKGDLTTNPLLVESRQQAALLARLCAALGLPSGDETQAPARNPRRAHRGFYGTRAGA